MRNRHFYTASLLVFTVLAIASGSTFAAPAKAKAKQTIQNATVNIAAETPAADVEKQKIIDAFYDASYNSCVTTGQTDEKTKAVLAKYPTDYLTTTCRCGVDRIKNNFDTEKNMAIINHLNDESKETPLQKAYAKSLFNTYMELVKTSGTTCANEYLQKHSTKTTN